MECIGGMRGNKNAILSLDSKHLNIYVVPIEDTTLATQLFLLKSVLGIFKPMVIRNMTTHIYLESCQHEYHRSLFITPSKLHYQKA